jgi:hypothetical protein
MVRQSGLNTRQWEVQKEESVSVEDSSPVWHNAMVTLNGWSSHRGCSACGWQAAPQCRLPREEGRSTAMAWAEGEMRWA